ncbi:hypothetical protein Leryth_002812 [Lithospermum erythrorhizon]|nr:hypothetical protein Leryth_002812 [Lithospermum erythrorhizon]
MEGGGVLGTEQKRRGRKRKNVEVQNVTTDRDGKKRVLAVRSMVYVGRYVKKEFEGSGVFLGKIVYYDSGFYRVDYEDGDCEDLESNEVVEFLVEEIELEGKWLERRKQLDELVLKKYGKEKEKAVDSNADSVNVVDDKADVAPLNVKMSSDGNNCNQAEEKQSDGDCDSNLLSELSEDDQELESISDVVEVPPVPPPELPSSSGNIGIPEQYVSHLLSVYSFLRSFSIQLFLSPFGLDDFVGSLNCTLPNTLLESVHVALMRTLRSHLEKGSSDGSELAAKCLRFLDWTLLDTMTWPIYLVHYFKIMGYANGPEWKDFCYHAMERDYFNLSAGWKLLALQILCDDVLDSEVVRSEIDMREESELGIDSDAAMVMTPSSGPRRVHPRYSKTSACKDQDAMRMMTVNQNTSKVRGQDAESDDEDGNSDECRLCGMDGMLLCCDGCPHSYHSRCIGVSKLSIPEGDWFCPECTMNKVGPITTGEAALKGAEVFGIDAYEQVFVGSCNYLLVLNGSINSNPCLRYYCQQDIPRLLEALNSNVHYISLYREIHKGIVSCWEIPESVLHSMCSTPETGVLDQGCRTSIQSDQLGQNIDTDLLKQSSQTSFNPVMLEQTPIHSSDNQTSFNLPNHDNYRVVRDVVNGRRDKPAADVLLFMGSSFKVQGYINNYLHGDFAASAAASLSALTSDEEFVSRSSSVDSRRKVLSANYALQAKAFSAAAIRFFWPHTGKKLVEGPRERCSWCLACKAPVASKRGCLLNAAAILATKGAMKVLATLWPPKNGEGSIPSIATYIMFMEESLSGLTDGPFQGSSFRKQWHKQLEQATSCRVIKTLLLEFEENIRTVAVSGDWVKLVDGWSSESSVVQSGALLSVGSSQKRRPGRRGRKASVVSEVNDDDDSQENLADITWWRGGKLLQFLSQEGTLPHGLVKKAARQGGSRRIPGVYYTEGVETAKRSRRLVWRAAVDMCKNVAQLALQVRYLDIHVKWADLVRPEQSAQEAKGAETESSVFRNALIFDKKIVDNETRYCVAFGSQKHLPSKVIKNVLEKGQTDDGKEKYWFSEFRVPLYLIKEFEINAAKKVLQTGEKSQRTLSKLGKQLKASRKNIFLYLVRKRDNKEKIDCASCQLGVLLGIAVQCSTCQGLCHETCTVSSTVQTSEEVQYMNTCKECYQARAQSEIQKNESPTSPLQGSRSAEIPFSYNQGSASTGISRNHVNVKPTKEALPASSSKPKCNWGLIWRRRKGDDKIGEDFVRKNILLKGNPNIHSLKPMCHLCSRPYNRDLMYIHCEACNHWFHADAVGLQEEKICVLLGFKCCKCRRIRSPTCPYSGPDGKQIFGIKKLRVKGPKLENMAVGPIPCSMQEQQDLLPRSEEISYFAYDDPQVISSEVQPQSENHPQSYYDWNPAPVSGPRKLKVRRSTKRENDEDPFTTDGSGYALSSTSFDGQIGNSVEEPSIPLVEWDVSANGFDDNMMFDFDCLDNEDAEFEPQTYFSFNELLSADDGGALQGMELSADATENWEISNSIQGNEHPDSLVYQPGDPVPTDFTTDTVACSICSHRNPPPDHVCQTCGVSIHSHCSPWVEAPSGDGQWWKCGNCREWR